MLYDRKSGTLIETVAVGLVRSDGSLLNERGVEALAARAGRNSEQGPVHRVSLDFMLEDEAYLFLDACKRCRVGCRVVSAETGELVTLFAAPAAEWVDAHELRGPLLPILREERWPEVAQSAHRRLFRAMDQGPWVTFAYDQGDTLARLPIDEVERRPLADIEAEALANLGKQTFSLERAGDAVNLVHEYAPEALLLPRVCALLCDTLKVPLCLVAAHEKMVVASGPTNFTMVDVARRMFDQAPGRRVSPIPLVVSPEGVQGFATNLPRPPPGKPWWRFW